MEIETDSPRVAARYVKSRLDSGFAAEITYPAHRATRIWFFPVMMLGVKDTGGIIVACERGGAIQFDKPEQINRFACIRSRMPSWAATFVSETLKELLSLNVVKPSNGQIRAVAHKT